MLRRDPRRAARGSVCRSTASDGIGASSRTPRAATGEAARPLPPSRQPTVVACEPARAARRAVCWTFHGIGVYVISDIQSSIYKVPPSATPPAHYLRRTCPDTKAVAEYQPLGGGYSATWWLIIDHSDRPPRRTFPRCNLSISRTPSLQSAVPHPCNQPLEQTCYEIHLVTP